MDIVEQIKSYLPYNEQEETDKAEILYWLEHEPNVFSRDNYAAHFTASSWVVSPDRKKVLMIYHNIYNSWAWMGGHADGEKNLMSVALRETQEESGIKELVPLSGGIFSMEILTVDGHMKRGKYVSSHLHLNLTYLFEADPKAEIRIKPDENSGVSWFRTGELPTKVSEPWMLQRIYSKLIDKTRNYQI